MYNHKKTPVINHLIYSTKSNKCKYTIFRIETTAARVKTEFRNCFSYRWREKKRGFPMKTVNFEFFEIPQSEEN